MQSNDLSQVCGTDTNATEDSPVPTHVVPKTSVFDDAKNFHCGRCNQVCDKLPEAVVENKNSDQPTLRCTDCVRDLTCRSCWKVYADTPVDYCFLCALQICDSCTYHCVSSNCSHLRYCVTCWRDEVKTCSLCDTVRCDFFDSFDCVVCGGFVCGGCVPQTFDGYSTTKNVCVHCTAPDDDDGGNSHSAAKAAGPIKTIA